MTVNFEAQFHLKGEGRAEFILCFCSIQHTLGSAGSKLCDTNQAQQGGHNIVMISVKREQRGAWEGWEWAEPLPALNFPSLSDNSDTASAF